MTAQRHMHLGNSDLIINLSLFHNPTCSLNWVATFLQPNINNSGVLYQGVRVVVIVYTLIER